MINEYYSWIWYNILDMELMARVHKQKKKKHMTGWPNHYETDSVLSLKVGQNDMLYLKQDHTAN